MGMISMEEPFLLPKQGNDSLEVKLLQRNKQISYRNRTGLYGFDGWNPGDEPSQTFMKGDYIACLHGCMFGLLILADKNRSHQAIEDDGILHELVHGLHIGRKYLEADVYKFDKLKIDIRKLERDTLDKYQQLLAEAEQYERETGKQKIFRFEPDENAELEAAQEVQQEARSERLYYQTYGRGLRPSVPVRFPMLQRSREEAEISAANYIEAGRSDDVRTGDIG
jgi:hypothetical protein